MLTPSHFLYRRSLDTCDALVALFQSLWVALNLNMREGSFSWTSQLHLVG